MKIHVQWDCSKQYAILFSFKQGWVWQDLLKAQALARLMIKTVTHEVDYVLDLRHITQIDSTHMRPFQLVLKERQPNLHRIYFVGTNPLLEKVLKTYTSMHPAICDHIVFSEGYPVRS